jgi:pyridoxal phosphate enzyme (YggS family)
MIAANVENIRHRIGTACARAGRSPEDVILVAVSKTFPPEKIREVLASGVPDIGENYAQELLRKREALPDPSIRWHFIGHLQSNKVKQILGFVHMIQAVDSVDIAREIDKRGADLGRTIDVLIEVNTTGEASKYGVMPRRVGEFLKGLEPLSSVRVCGLMTMGFFGPDPEVSRPLFRQLRLLRDDLSGLRQHNVHMRHLSMGMTGDFEVAIEEGATIVRIGTAIFGPRTRKEPGREASHKQKEES